MADREPIGFLQRIGVDTPEEFVLLFLAVGVELFLGYLVFAQEESVDKLWTNPFVGFWLGRAGVKAWRGESGDRTST